MMCAGRSSQVLQSCCQIALTADTLHEPATMRQCSPRLSIHVCVFDTMMILRNLLRPRPLQILQLSKTGKETHKSDVSAIQ
jgi:hypothetical protein